MRSGRDPFFRRTITSTAFQAAAPRTTRKSDRRKASDRTMVGTAQPVCLSASGIKRRRYESTMNLRKRKIHRGSFQYGGWTARPFSLCLAVAGEEFVLTSPFIERDSRNVGIWPIRLAGHILIRGRDLGRYVMDLSDESTGCGQSANCTLRLEITPKNNLTIAKWFVSHHFERTSQFSSAMFASTGAPFSTLWYTSTIGSPPLKVQTSP